MPIPYVVEKDDSGADIEVLKRREGRARVQTIGEGTIQP